MRLFSASQDGRSWLVAGLSMVMVAGILALLTGLIARFDLTSAPQLAESRHVISGEAPDELTMRFQQAAMMLHAREYEHAVTALHRVLELSPRMPEAHVNMGYALLGLERFEAAKKFFLSATELRPYQANAYWGLAVAFEKSGELQSALGAMRTFIHLAEPGDPFVRRARSALWEWEDSLRRGPLPEHERTFLERGMQQWEDRNSPDQDVPAGDGSDGEQRIPLRSLMD